jgi:hypothetical protein
MNSLFLYWFTILCSRVLNLRSPRGGLVLQYLELLLGDFAESAIFGDEAGVNALDVVLEGGIAREQTLTEDAFEWLEFHVNALRMIFQMRNRLKSLSTIWVSTSERSHALCMSQKVVLQMLFLLERLVATFKAAFELTLVAFEMPIKFTLADKLAIKTDRALEL